MVAPGTAVDKEAIVIDETVSPPRAQADARCALGITVNGVDSEVVAARDRTLLEVLRGDLGLTAAKPGCGEGVCGACTVLLDGEPVRACVTPATAVAGRSILTVEGLCTTAGLHPVQQALIDEGAMQCGYCTPGIVISSVALLQRRPDPGGAEIRDALAGHVCRCGGYARVERAIRRAAAAIREGNRGMDGGPTRRRRETNAFRPRTPWDLTPVSQREYFELLGDGLMVVLEPDQTAPTTGRMSGSMRGGGAWLHVAVDGSVTAFAGKVDIGQDNRTALTLIVAEELAVVPDHVAVVMGDTDLCPFDMGTFGSRSMPGAGEDLRICAASAAAALTARGHPASGEQIVTIASAAVRTTSPQRWRVRGRDAPRATAAALVDGTHRFASDLSLPGMLHGKVLWPPRYGATLEHADTAAARALPGVTVVQLPGFVAAAAADARAAAAALEAIEAEWTAPEAVEEQNLESHLRTHPIEVPGWGGAVDEREGDVERALTESATVVQATYRTAHIAHVSMETRVALARWDGDRLTVWTGTQQPYLVRHQVAAALGASEERVRVIVPDTGGGFGSKHTEDLVIAAARLSRAAGLPVRIALSREEEFRHSYCRPAAVIDVRAGLGSGGRIAAWDFVNINSGAAALATPYDVPDRRMRFVPADSPLPEGPFRALAATANTFARECHVDELARAAGADPLRFRIDNLGDGRLVAVLRAAADRGGWDRLRSGAESGSGVGLACGTEKGGRVATYAHVRVEGDRLEIVRLVTVYECGAIINPDNVRRQIEGATVMGLGGALFESLHFAGGRIVNASLRCYRVPRIGDLPPIEVMLLDRPDLPAAGAGETPMIAVAPALANAIFAACGRRIRSLPLLDEGGLTLVSPSVRPTRSAASS